MPILTFAVLFDLRLVGDERDYLGKNHRKLAIPADKRRLRKKNPVTGTGQFAGDWIFLLILAAGPAAATRSPPPYPRTNPVNSLE